MHLFLCSLDFLLLFYQEKSKQRTTHTDRALRLKHLILKTYFKFTANMDITITVRGRTLRVCIQQHITRITNDKELTALLAHDTEAATGELITAIKARYQEEFGKELKVSDKSMAVEIWAHVYVEKFAKAIASLKVIRKLADAIIRRCEIIDIGEWGHDQNRFVWNALSIFKTVIAALLPNGK
jgi:hypothetical protein